MNNIRNVTYIYRNYYAGGNVTGKENVGEKMIFGIGDEGFYFGEWD